MVRMSDIQSIISLVVGWIGWVGALLSTLFLSFTILSTFGLITMLVGGGWMLVSETRVKLDDIHLPSTN